VNNKKFKIILFSILSAVLFVGLFVAADYYSLFGTKTNLKLDFVEVRIRTLDADTGGLVLDAGVRCFQKNNMNACTRRDSHRAGIVSAHIPVRREIVSTYLFRKSEEIIKTVVPEIHIMLIHQKYNNQTMTILLEDVYANKVKEYSVQMPPGKWVEQEESLIDE